ncbi:MAG: helix-turn-helix domain-containing protein [Janthinobacterium lividum]
MGRIRYFEPAAELRPYLSSYYWFETDAALVDDLIRAELGQVRFIVAGSSAYCFDGRYVDCPSTVLTGPTLSPVRFIAEGPLKVFGAGILPAGWSALIREAADRLADDAIDLGDLGGPVGPAARDCLGRLTAAASDGERVAAADAFFTTLGRRARAVPRWFTQLTDDWLTASPNPQVDALIAASAMSSRQVERLCQRVYGGSPKVLARKYRALQAAARLGDDDARGWADAAGEAFYDQSHFIREFKQFIGTTPNRFAGAAAGAVQLAAARRRMLPNLPKLALYS